MYFYEKKWFLALVLLIPNMLVAWLMNPANPAFALGSGLGAATMVFLFYLICRSLLQRSRLNKRWHMPLGVVCAYAVYYVYMYVI